MTARIAVVTVSDRASSGVYEDKGGPAAEGWLRRVITSPVEIVRVVIPDGRNSVADTFRRLVDQDGFDLILATGGTGPAPRDETPEAMADVVEKDLPGFGELMRAVSLREVPTAILSRQGAGTRGKCLIVTLPGKPSAIGTCLDAVFPAVPYCLDLIGAGRIETNPDLCKAFRPGT
jgi:molybdopterin adenylyltransferase